MPPDARPRAGQLATTKDYRAPTVDSAEVRNTGPALARIPPPPDATAFPSFPRALSRQPEHASPHSYANSNSLFAMFAQPILTLQPKTGAIEPGLFSILFEPH